MYFVYSQIIHLMKALLISLPFFLFTILYYSCNNSSESTSETDQDERLEKSDPTVSLVWKTDTTFSDSESTLYDAGNKAIYVSCGNNSLEKDGDGFIAVLHPDGSVKSMDWCTGLNAPKGMAILDNSLYVSDIDE